MPKPGARYAQPEYHRSECHLTLRDHPYSSAREDDDKPACSSIGQNILEWNCLIITFSGGQNTREPDLRKIRAHERATSLPGGAVPSRNAGETEGICDRRRRVPEECILR